MIPWTRLARAPVPEGGELVLMRRGAEVSIRLDRPHERVELMNSRLHGSEEALATMALARVGAARPRVLVGGLGMGFTLRAVLLARPDAQVTVAEIVPEIVAWARGPMADLFGDELDRATIRTADVRTAIDEGVMDGGGWDAILLDVDNGPDGLSRAGNDALYDRAGLARARRALRPGGVLAVWSSGDDPRFTRRLERSGFAVAVERVPAHKGKRGPRHTLWFAAPR